eukprot:355664-Chlamydomonas_euryale.AAC.10
MVIPANNTVATQPYKTVAGIISWAPTQVNKKTGGVKDTGEVASIEHDSRISTGCSPPPALSGLIRLAGRGWAVAGASITGGAAAVAAPRAVVANVELSHHVGHGSPTQAVRIG